MEVQTAVKERFIKYIDSVIENNKISHAYLIELDDYDKDFTYVMTFIKMILCNCSYEELEKADQQIIHLIDTNQYPDIYTISSETNVINKNMISDLQKEFVNKSMFDNKRIYIIKEAEKLNASSANTILKFLEEPEDDIIAFLITDNRYHIIDTIMSRCQILSLKENNYIDTIDDELLDIIDIIIHPQQYFLKYNDVSKTLFSDKLFIKNRLSDVEKVLLMVLSNQVPEEHQNILDLLKDKKSNVLVSILSIIEDELPKLNFNVNLKLWCDSFFSHLIGG
jgi:DNA polymerase-3 subunit delta'